MSAAEPDSTAQATFDVGRICADSVLITVAGEVDLANYDRFQAAVDRALQAGATKLIFDLAGVRFMDSFGLHILLKTTHSPATVEIRNPSPAVHRLIEITGLTTILDVGRGSPQSGENYGT